MRGNEFLEKMGLIDPAYIEEADAVPKRKRLAPLKKILIAAAGFVLMLSVGFGGYTYAAEAIEYNNAVLFFDEYELSTEGLSRDEIKSVYRDITTNSFSDRNTVIVIANNFDPDKIKEYGIPNENSTPKDVEEFWNFRNASIFDMPGETPEETDAPRPPSRGCVGPHKYEYRVITEGSCTEEGTAGNVCVNCGYFTVMATTGKVHSFGEYAVTVEATCESSGREVAECTLCGAKDEKYIPAGHVINEKNSRIVEESTCMKKGTVKYECTVCGETITERLPLIAHDWYITVQEATCTKNGFKTGVCQGCGTERRFEEYFRLGHDFKLIWNGDWKCMRCNTMHSQLYKYHDVIKTTVKKSTCTEKGIVRSKCVKCGIQGEAETTKSMHNNDYTKEEVVEATCIREGTRKLTCIDCGYVTVYTSSKESHKYEFIGGSEKKCRCTVCGIEILGNFSYSQLLDIIDSITIDGNMDESYNYGSRLESHKDVYVTDKNASIDGADGDFVVYVALGQKGMYIYAEIKDSTSTAAKGEECGDYIKLYLDWCTPDFVHPSEQEKQQMANSGDPWDPVEDYKNIYGVSGLQYLGWLQGYSNGNFYGGMGFAPVEILGPDASDAVVYKSKATDDGWACEWFIPWRDANQKRMIKNKVAFHIGVGIEVGDDTLINDGKDKATVKRFDRNKESGIKYSEDYSLLPDLSFGELWVYK